MLDKLKQPPETPDNEPIRSLGDLIFAAHHAATLKGWWPVDGRPLAESINNLHAEISEAWEDYRANKLTKYYETTLSLGSGVQQKPCGFWVEIADAVIRLADLCGGEAWCPREEEFDDLKVDLTRLPDVILASHERITDLGQMPHKNVVASQLFALWFVSAGVADVDLWELIDEKMKFNRTRPQRHGGKLA